MPEGVKHLDETGFRIGGKTQWLHVLSTPWLTFYRTSAQRGSLLAGLRGILVHDHWGAVLQGQGGAARNVAMPIICAS